MSEKTKKMLMRELYKGIAATVIFAILFAACLFPNVKTRVNKLLTKDTDLKKVASLLIDVAKEIAPFR